MREQDRKERIIRKIGELHTNKNPQKYKGDGHNNGEHDIKNVYIRRKGIYKPKQDRGKDIQQIFKAHELHLFYYFISGIKKLYQSILI